jgi:phosphotransferase system enzyme I (PtsI)
MEEDMGERNMKVISECCEMLVNATDPGKSLPALCKYLADAFNAEMAVICAWDNQESRFVLRAAFGLYVDEIRTLNSQNDLDSTFFNGNMVLNSVLTAGMPLGSIKISASLANRCGSMLLLPLRLGGKLIGSLCLARKIRQVFPESTVESCRVLGLTLAGFLQDNELSRAQAQREENRLDHLPPGSLSNIAAGIIGRSGKSFCAGTPIVPGVCCGRCRILPGDDALQTVVITKTGDIAAQLKRLDVAYDSARLAISKVSREIGELISEADEGIFDMYMILLEDPTLRQQITGFIEEGYNLESALALTSKVFQKEFQGIEDEYLRERFQDVQDVLLRLLTDANNAPSVQPKTASASGSLVLVARELFPSQLVSAPLKQVCGIVCERGGATSHAAILARALHIPMLVGLNGIATNANPGDKILADCYSGICYLEPETALLRRYQPQITASKRLRSTGSNPSAPADDLPETTDGTQVKLCGNVTLFSEVPMLHAAGIREIGLYRTEFMFMIRPNMPDEQTQFNVLQNLIYNAQGAPVTIRTLDIGGDKSLPYLNLAAEQNPALGCRGLRFLLESPDIAQSHLRAILRSCTAPGISVMFPMVSDLHDLRSIKDALEKARLSLEADRIPYGVPRIGMMLEVPSAVACLDQMLPLVDFVSIGTNDLVQYLFAVDRNNNRVTGWFRQCHPAVLRILGEICDKASEFPGKEVSICGELAANCMALPLLLGAGLRKLSMNSTAIGDVRNYIRSLSIDECRRIYLEACNCDTHQDVRLLIEAEYQKHQAAYNRKRR